MNKCAAMALPSEILSSQQTLPIYAPEYTFFLKKEDKHLKLLNETY
jgi:hypothetical protein